MCVAETAGDVKKVLDGVQEQVDGITAAEDLSKVAADGTGRDAGTANEDSDTERDGTKDLTEAAVASAKKAVMKENRDVSCKDAPTQIQIVKEKPDVSNGPNGTGKNLVPIRR